MTLQETECFSNMNLLLPSLLMIIITGKFWTEDQRIILRWDKEEEMIASCQVQKKNTEVCGRYS